MADITAKLADGTVLQFPEGTPDDVIDRVVQEHIAAAGKSGGTEAPVSDEPAPVESEPDPLADAEAPAAGENVAAYEEGLRQYYQQLAEKKGAFDPNVVQGLASKYGVGPISNLAEVEEFYKQYGTLNPRLSTVSLMKEPPPTPKQDELVGTVPQVGDLGQSARAFGKGFLFDFADELEAATRMLASGEISSDEYYKIKRQINDDYNAWAAANPGTALALEAAGGITGSFVPGLGVVGRGAQAVTGLSRVGNVALRSAGTGALAGGLSGLGQAETMRPSDLASSTLYNAGIGAVTSPIFAKGFEYAGRGVNSARQRFEERFGPSIEVFDDEIGDFVRIPNKRVTPEELKASEMLYEAAGQRGPQRAVGEAALAGKYGVPTPLGLSTPRMTALTEKVVQKPSSGQEGLAEALYATRAGTPEFSATSERIGEQARQALPGAKDYFGEEEAITQRLRNIGDNEYQRAYAVGEVRDPTIASIINNPSSTIRSIWRSAQNLAELKGSDLRMRMEPVLDEGGNLIGLAPTTDAVPNVEALDLFKRALDDRIEAGFKGKSSEGKSEAAALKDIRNALVSRMDDLVPEYREARTKYAGDMEVRDALRYGLDIFSRKVRPAEFRKQLAGMSVAEREAVKSGALEAIFRDIEGSQGRDLAKRIAGTPEKLAKLKDIMGPAEAKFFERAMRRESELYQRTAKVTGGSRTAPLAEGMRQLDEAIQGGNLDDAVALLTSGPVGRMAIFARWVAGLNPRKEFGDKVYTTLSKALASQKPEELREVLDMLRRSKTYAERIQSLKETAAAPVAAVAGATMPSAFEDRGMQPPPFTERDMTEEEALAADAEAIATGAPDMGVDVSIGEEPAAEEPAVPEQGTVMMDGREVVYDEASGQYLDPTTGEVVSNFAKGGRAKKKGYDYANAARTFGQGLTFGFGDEIEARLRAGLDDEEYRRERDRIRALQELYAQRNPKMAMALEGAGMVGGSMLAPSLGGARVLANAPRAARFAVGAADDLLQGAAYGAGKARERRDIANDIRQDALGNALAYSVASGVGAGGRRLARTAPARAAIDLAARPIRYAVKKVR